MGTRYQHLSKEERDLIAVLKAKGCSMGEIGESIGRDKATISRELRRNALEIRKGYYLNPCYSHSMSLRAHAAGKQVAIADIFSKRWDCFGTWSRAVANRKEQSVEKFCL